MKQQSAIGKRWLGIAMSSALLVMGTTSAMAVTIAETEDNGTFATADGTVPGATLTGSIGDNTAASNDVDLWSFVLEEDTNFSANISYTGTWNPFDVNPVVSLFWENGGSYYPVASTDPNAGFGTSVSFTPWATGNYILAVTADFNQGVDAFGNFASDFSFQTSENILGTPWAGWWGQSFTSFDYELTTAGSSPVPVPAAVWLFGSGLVGLLGVARRRRNKV